MKLKVNLLLGILFIAFFNGIIISNQQDNISGAWKGTSICQQENSPCKNETVVYHITKSKDPDTYKFVMNKIVNTVEENMGVLFFSYDSTYKRLTCHSVNRFESFWTFNVEKNTMSGTLTVDKKNLYRIIKLLKN